MTNNKNKQTILQQQQQCLYEKSIDELFCFEVPSQIEHLPRSQTKQTQHAEYKQVQHSGVGGFYIVLLLLL